MKKFYFAVLLFTASLQCNPIDFKDSNESEEAAAQAPQPSQYTIKGYFQAGREFSDFLDCEPPDLSLLNKLVTEKNIPHILQRIADHIENPEFLRLFGEFRDDSNTPFIQALLKVSEDRIKRYRDVELPLENWFATMRDKIQPNVQRFNQDGISVQEVVKKYGHQSSKLLIDCPGMQIAYKDPTIRVSCLDDDWLRYRSAILSCPVADERLSLYLSIANLSTEKKPIALYGPSQKGSKQNYWQNVSIAIPAAFVGDRTGVWGSLIPTWIGTTKKLTIRFVGSTQDDAVAQLEKKINDLLPRKNKSIQTSYPRLKPLQMVIERQKPSAQ